LRKAESGLRSHWTLLGQDSVHDEEEDEADTVDGLAATEGNGVANSWRLASGNAMPLLLLLLLLLEKATLPSP